MINLDDLPAITKIDSLNILGSINRLPDQIEQSWRETNLITTANDFDVKNVTICGMGGSALGGRIIDSLIKDRIRVPIEVSTNFDIPHYVNNNSLVIISSYSGNTEETINAFFEAMKANAKVFGIVTGGKLAQIFDKEKIPSYVFDPIHNPSNQPRMGLGYSIGSLMAILSKLNLISVSQEEIDLVVKITKDLVIEYGVQTPSSKNVAKTIANKLVGKIPALIASEHLIGNSHAFKNQLNENAKTFALIFDLPELNHHLMEGLKFPIKTRDLLTFLMLESRLYSPTLVKRYQLTKEVIEKNGYICIGHNMQEKTKLGQVFELLVFSEFVSFYLAVLNNIDPGPIPWVDYFKQKLL